MNENDITEALCGRIDTANILPAYMPNELPTAALKAAVNYLDVSFAASRTKRSGLSANSVVQKIAILQCAIVVPEGTGVTAAQNYAQQIKELFTASPVLKLTITGGVIVVGTVDVKSGYPVDGEYRIPVHIPFNANQT